LYKESNPVVKALLREIFSLWDEPGLGAENPTGDTDFMDGTDYRDKAKKSLPLCIRKIRAIRVVFWC